MTAIDELIPTPRLLEIDTIHVRAPIVRVWDHVRHGELGKSRLVRALFALRELPRRLSHDTKEQLRLSIDTFAEHDGPGFRLLVDEPQQELVVGAIGKVWIPEIPFVYVRDRASFTSFSEPGFIKVAWAVRVDSLDREQTRVVLELRVDATDEEAWAKFVDYFRFIGPASRFIRRVVMREIEDALGASWSGLEDRMLPGDELMPEAQAQMTHEITVRATPAAIWPWLVQMGCGRAGFYSVDTLDNRAKRSAREVHPKLQALRVGDRIASTPGGDAHFEVLRLEPDRVLVLGALFDADASRQVPFSAAPPRRFWRTTWAFSLEPLGDRSTQIHVRARAGFSQGERFHAAWIRPVHAFMERQQLEHLAARVEGRLPRDDWRDVAEGLSGALVAGAALLTPFLEPARSHWGLSEEAAARAYPGDELVPEPTWGWTHGIEIEKGADDVWPWLAQIGADRAGFYSYQWLENVVGCDVRNAETIHPEWEVDVGHGLRLHPEMPPLPVTAVSKGRYFVAHARAPRRDPSEPWVDVSWLFFVEPLTMTRCRFISRYRCAMSADLMTRLKFGRMTMEPVGFAMDRRMLLGVKERAERSP